jgi:hypothetical protein
VYWIGGGSGSGKSSVARRLAVEHGFRVYATDDAVAAHVARTTPKESPALARFLGMDMDERWLTQTPETMLETFHWFRGEGFQLILEDLLGLPTEPPVIAEGFRLLPRLVKPLLAIPSRAVWLLPTPELRYAAFERRGSLWRIAERTTDPPHALQNLLERDRLFTERLREETRRLGLRALVVDRTTSEADIVDRVTDAFALPSSP